MIDWSNLQRDYEKLGSQKAVAEKYGCTRQAVYNQMRRRKIPAKPLPPGMKRQPRTWTWERLGQWKNLQVDYDRLGSYSAVAQEYGTTVKVVERVVKKLGIKVNPPGVHLKGVAKTWTPERLAQWENLQADYDRLLSVRAVAEEYGYSKKVVMTAMKYLGIAATSMRGREIEWSEEHRANHKRGCNRPEVIEKHRAALIKRLEEGRVTGPSQGSPLETLLHGALQRAGLSFATQRRKLDRYVVDIELLQAPVIIEADGLRHQLDRQKAKDIIRDAALTEAGYRVFRFTGTEINAGPDACIQRVVEAAGVTPESEPVASIRIGARGADNPNWRPESRYKYTCTHCGAVFEKYRQARSYKKTFCTQKCYGAWMSDHPEQSPVHARWNKHRAQQMVT